MFFFIFSFFSFYSLNPLLSLTQPTAGPKPGQMGRDEGDLIHIRSYTVSQLMLPSDGHVGLRIASKSCKVHGAAGFDRH